MVKKLLVLSALVTTLGASTAATAYEPYVNIGVNYHMGKYHIGVPEIDNNREYGTDYHLGLGIRNYFGASKNHLLGAGIDLDKALGKRIIGYRAVDYQYQFNSKIRSGLFLGAASLDSGLPQNGYYVGLNASWLKAFAGIDLSVELRQANGLSRDRLLDSDVRPPNGKPDIFLDITSVTAALNWRF